MHTLLTPTFIILLFVLVRSADIAISASRTHDTVRTICYGLVAVLALIVVILSFI